MPDEAPEYPKAAYRLGTQFEFEGKMLDMRILADAEDEKAALAEGWSLSPAVETPTASGAQPEVVPPLAPPAAETAEGKPEEDGA